MMMMTACWCWLISQHFIGTGEFGDRVASVGHEATVGHDEFDSDGNT
jgi:hypothetical protein